MIGSRHGVMIRLFAACSGRRSEMTYWMKLAAAIRLLLRTGRRRRRITWVLGRGR
jgi:hypothetical protein